MFDYIKRRAYRILTKYTKIKNLFDIDKKLHLNVDNAASCGYYDVENKR